QQDVGGDAHVFVAGRRRAEAGDERRGHGVVGQVAGQGAAHGPLLGLAGRQAAVVLLGQPGRAVAGAHVGAIVVVDGLALRAAEIGADVDADLAVVVVMAIIAVMTALVPVAAVPAFALAALAMLVALAVAIATLALACPGGLVGE